MVLAGPGNRVDTQSYIQLLLDCARDPGFTADRALAAMQAIGPVSGLEAMAVRGAIVPLARQMAKAQAPDHAWMATRPAWGPGRIDPFNPVKVRMLRLPQDNTIGSADNVPIWNKQAAPGWPCTATGSTVRCAKWS